MDSSLIRNVIKVAGVIILSAWLTWLYMYLVETAVMKYQPLKSCEDAENDECSGIDQVESTTEDSTAAGTKTILMWTSYFGDPSWTYGTLEGKHFFEKCNVKNCFVTNDKSYEAMANLVLFHCRDPVEYWPKIRHPWQYYTVECHESQIYSNMDEYSFHANISMTHRLDSDIYYPYFKTVPRERPLSRPYVPKVSFQGRTKAAVWPVSNCMSPSRRDMYAMDLSKYINVDIFGACGRYQCPRNMQKQCMDNFERDYKFYLSFENAFCDQYITEKFYNGLVRDLVPIVFGAGDYRKVAPPHSYIDAWDFESPAKLADFLLELSSNETAFNEYFQWKRKYRVYKPSRMCQMCEFLHNTRGLRRDATTFDIANWWNPYGVCDNDIYDPYTRTMKPRSSNRDVTISGINRIVQLKYKDHRSI